MTEHDRRVHICHRCKEQVVANGVRICGGQSTESRIVAGHCPLGRFAEETTIERSAKATPVPIPQSEWPCWAKAIAVFKSAEDAGVGDTVHRRLGALGEAFRATMKKIGVPCGCDARQAEWNAKYPYGCGQTPDPL